MHHGEGQSSRHVSPDDAPRGVVESAASRSAVNDSVQAAARISDPGSASASSSLLHFSDGFPGGELRTPAVELRPTSATEQARLKLDTERSEESLRIWASIPDLDHREMLQTLDESRGGNATMVGGETSGASPNTSAPSSRLGSASRPGSGPSRSRFHQLTSAVVASTAALLAAKAQQSTDDRIFGESGGPAVHRALPSSSSSTPQDGRPLSQSSFISSLHFRDAGRSTIRVRQQSKVYSSQPQQQQQGHEHPRRHLTAAPLSLLHNFEERVRAQTPYRVVNVDALSRLERLAQTPSAGPSVPARRAESSVSFSAVGTRPTATSLDPRIPFHVRGDYTSSIGESIDALEYFSFEKQRIADIHERNLQLKADVVHARHEKSLMAAIKRGALRDDAAFWRANRPPTIVDLERLLPNRGNNTREVDILMGKLTEDAKAVDVGVEPTKWTTDEKHKFFQFIGRNPPKVVVVAKGNRPKQHQQERRR